MNNKPETTYAYGYRIVFSNKGKTAKATMITGIGRKYTDAVKLVNTTVKLGFLLSRPNPKEPDTLVFRKKPKSQ